MLNALGTRRTNPSPDTQETLPSHQTLSLHTGTPTEQHQPLFWPAQQPGEKANSPTPPLTCNKRLHENKPNSHERPSQNEKFFPQPSKEREWLNTYIHVGMRVWFTNSCTAWWVGHVNV